MLNRNSFEVTVTLQNYSKSDCDSDFYNVVTYVTTEDKCMYDLSTDMYTRISCGDGETNAPLFYDAKCTEVWKNSPDVYKHGQCTNLLNPRLGEVSVTYLSCNSNKKKK